MENVFEYDPTSEDLVCGYPGMPKGYHPVKMDDGTIKYIPNDEQEF